MKATLLLAVLLCCGCGSQAPHSSAPAEAPQPAPIAGPAPTDAEPAGRKIWEVIPGAPHGQCCTSDDECGPITCEPYEHGHSGCEKVCTYACEPGDLCPPSGGALMPPPPCPESGLCPVGRPNV